MEKNYEKIPKNSNNMKAAHAQIQRSINKATRRGKIITNNLMKPYFKIGGVQIFGGGYVDFTGFAVLDFGTL